MKRIKKYTPTDENQLLKTFVVAVALGINFFPSVFNFFFSAGLLLLLIQTVIGASFCNMCVHAVWYWFLNQINNERPKTKTYITKARTIL